MPDPAANAIPPVEAKDSPAKYRLGVLLVHGIGTQPAGDILGRWGDVLLETIERATRGRVVPTVEQARPGTIDGASPAEAVVRLRHASYDDETWLLSEGWWADTFLSPTYRELVSWSVRALPWAIGIHVAQRYWRSTGHEGRWVRIRAAIIATLQLLLAFAAAPLFILLLAAALLIGLLPIPQLRSLILTAQSTLTSSIGDSLAFVESPIRAALIRTRLLDRLERLRGLCDRTIVVAHSQGAALVLEALGGLSAPGAPSSSPEEEDRSASTVVPDTLLTFGAGTNQLASLRALHAGLPERLGMNPASYAMGGLLVAGSVAAWLYSGVVYERFGPSDLLLAVGLFAALVGVFTALVFGLLRLMPLVAKNLAFVRDHERQITVISLSVIILAVSIWMFEYADRSGVPMAAIALLSGALIVIAGSLVMFLSGEMRSVVTTVHNPPGLHRWFDVYATDDPVPHGPTRTSESGTPQSVEVSNLGSALADHTSYWQNLDGFVLRFARACAGTAKSPWINELPAERAVIDLRSAWRLEWLKWARRATFLGWAWIGVVTWLEMRTEIPIPFAIPAAIAPTVAPAVRFIGLAFALLIGIGLTGAVLTSIWARWARREQEAVLAHRLPEDGDYLPLVAMWIIPWLLIVIAFVASREGFAAITEAATSTESLLTALTTAAGLSGASVFLLRWRRPAPRMMPTTPPPEVAADKA